MSFVYPLWTICKSSLERFSIILTFIYAGSFDSAVHISEEATIAALAVPWAIISSILVAGTLGFGAINLHQYQMYYFGCAL